MTFLEAINNIPGYIAIACVPVGLWLLFEDISGRRKPPTPPTSRQQVLDSLGITEDDVNEDGEAAELMFKR